MWTGHESSRVATTLLDVLVRMRRLDFAYVRATAPAEGSLGTASTEARLVEETDRDRAAFIRTYFSRASPNRPPVR